MVPTNPNDPAITTEHSMNLDNSPAKGAQPEPEIVPPSELSPKETLAVAAYNNPLREAYDRFNRKQVRIKASGIIGKVIGVDPRPRGYADGIWLVIKLDKPNVLPGRCPTAITHALASDVEIVK